MQELAEKYKKATQDFLNLVTQISPNQLDNADKEGWTPRQVIHHLADSEAQSYSRLRRLIAEPGSLIQGYDENKWAESSKLGYKSEDVQSSLEVFKAVRQASYELIKKLSEEDLEIEGTHSESGAYSVGKWIKTYTNHPLDHANQIREQLK